MQIYSAQVAFRARFTGLRWFMYRWKVTSFIVFSSFFWSVSMASASVTWAVLTWVVHTQPGADRVKDEDQELLKNEPEEADHESGKDVEVKKEPEQEESSSLLQRFPTNDDDGLGSGLESAEARGLQRRRSHRREGDHDS
ncbi:hypothetical protein N7470_002141 [Penicillium chermesinum]|nr:hypothetical protein N7470_002141 [Penicillium chermesinum]